MQEAVSHSNRIYIEIVCRCYAELNDFLADSWKYKPFSLQLKTPVLVSEALSMLGIPLSEVDLILVNSKPVERRHKLADGDYFSVYPTFETFDISSLKSNPHKVLRKTTFIADAHLGKLTKYLRMLGFDTLYRNDFGDEEIINISLKDNRIILTRDKTLLNSKRITHGYYIRSVNKHDQLTEVISKFDLKSQFKPFTRCMTCNGLLVPKLPEQIENLVDKETFANFNVFYYCPTCNKVFWQGSHFKRMESLILDITERVSDQKAGNTN